MIRIKDLDETEVNRVADLVEEIKYSDMTRQEFLNWYNRNKYNVYTFVDLVKDSINAFMILDLRRRRGKPEIFVHSIYVPSKSNGLSNEFHSKIIDFGKYLGIKRMRMRTTRKPESFIRRWGFNLDSYNLIKEIQ